MNSNTPARTLNEFIAYAKAAPRPLTYGTAGVGAPHHIAAELLRSMTGINIVHVPYKGSAGIVPALLSGEIDFTIGAVNSLLPHFKAGKLRPIAVAGSSRTAILPDVPTIAEAGPLPGYAVETRHQHYAHIDAGRESLGAAQHRKGDTRVDSGLTAGR